MRNLVRSGCWWMVAFGCSLGVMRAQSPPVPAAPSKVEPGLEEAVNWKWKVAAPANPEWGMPIPEALRPKENAAPAAKPVEAPVARPATYEVQKGDALIKIARKFNMTPDQLKQFNELKDDRIVIGQSLRIPTAGELLAMPPPVAPAKPANPKDGQPGKPEAPRVPEIFSYEQLELETVLLQVFLDREFFSAGAIDGRGGPNLDRVSRIYQETHPDAADPDRLKAKALAEVKQPYTNYMLRAEDFRFIKPASADPSKPAGRKAGKTAKTAPTVAPLLYQDLVSEQFLGYRSAWEFVAERFHCDESFLREKNAKVAANPSVGTVFQVPNVIPFEIEKAFETPMQPAADPQKPVTAAVVALSRLEIYQTGKLIAVMPLASARPGLRGRGTWTILAAIPGPRLVTRREPRETPKAAPQAGPATTPAPAAPLAADEFLASGPNNPVGVIWLNLAKANTVDPLPYGLHGTSIPARMRSQEGIGGFRLTNWDIARVVRLLPEGTGLQWKDK